MKKLIFTLFLIQSSLASAEFFFCGRNGIKGKKNCIEHCKKENKEFAIQGGFYGCDNGEERIKRENRRKAAIAKKERLKRYRTKKPKRGRNVTPKTKCIREMARNCDYKKRRPKDMSYLDCTKSIIAKKECAPFEKFLMKRMENRLNREKIEEEKRSKLTKVYYFQYLVTPKRAKYRKARGCREYYKEEMMMRLQSKGNQCEDDGKIVTCNYKTSAYMKIHYFKSMEECKKALSDYI